MIPLLTPAIVLIYVAIIRFNSRLPSRVQSIIIIILGLGSAWVNILVARAQVDGSGFFSASKDPNNGAMYIGYTLALAAVGGIWWWHKNKKQGHYYYRGKHIAYPNLTEFDILVPTSYTMALQN